MNKQSYVSSRQIEMVLLLNSIFFSKIKFCILAMKELKQDVKGLSFCKRQNITLSGKVQSSVVN